MGDERVVSVERQADGFYVTLERSGDGKAPIARVFCLR